MPSQYSPPKYLSRKVGSGQDTGEESKKHERGESKKMEKAESKPDMKGKADRPEFKGDKKDAVGAGKAARPKAPKMKAPMPPRSNIPPSMSRPPAPPMGPPGPLPNIPPAGQRPGVLAPMNATPLPFRRGQ